MQQKQHITHKGLLEIVKIKASLNLGLTDTLRSAFPNICATPRLLIIEKKKNTPFSINCGIYFRRG